MASSSLGYRIEWTSAFRESSGVVVRVISKDELCVLDDLMGEECRLKTTIPFTLRGPALKQFVDYHTKDISTFTEKKVHIMELFTEYFSATTWSAAKKEILASLVEETAKTKADEKEAEDEEEDGDNDDEEDQDEEESEPDEEDEEEEEEDDDEDESEEDDDTSVDDDDDEGTIVDFKIYMKDTDEVRGFSVSSSNGFAVIHKQLTDDYGTPPKLYYRDEESDNVALLAQSDFQYAVRIHQKANKTKRNKTTKPLKLTAEFPKSSSTARTYSLNTNTRAMGPLNEFGDQDMMFLGYEGGNGGDVVSGGGGIRGTRMSMRHQQQQQQQQQQRQQQSLLYRDRERIDTPNPLFPHTMQNIGFRYLEGSGKGPGLADRGQGLGSQSDILYGEGSGKGLIRQQSCEILWQQGELLGSGSFGQVFSGLDLSTGRRLAVKEVRLGSGKRQLQQATSLQQVIAIPYEHIEEIRILATLADHPNVIRYLGAEVQIDCLRIFLELATDGSIKDALNEFGPLSENVIRKYTLDIVQGLGFLHSLRIIHRDLKPSNLLVSDGVVKLADFGCSSLSMESLEYDNMGQSQSSRGNVTMVGTTLYMAPEVMHSTSESDNHHLSPLNAPLGAPLGAAAGTSAYPSDGPRPGSNPGPGPENLSPETSNTHRSHHSAIHESRDSPPWPSHVFGIMNQSGVNNENGVNNDNGVDHGNANGVPSRGGDDGDDDDDDDDNGGAGGGGGDGNGAITEYMTATVGGNHLKSPLRGITPSIHQHRQPLPQPPQQSQSQHQPSFPQKTTKGYGRKADIWSLGITLCEMAHGKPPFRTAAGAIYSVCVTKEFPTFPDSLSTEAHGFLSRCLVEQPRDRANCTELLEHPFLAPFQYPTSRDLRTLHRQTSGRHTLSTVSLRLSEDDLSRAESKTSLGRTSGVTGGHIAGLTAGRMSEGQGLVGGIGCDDDYPHPHPNPHLHHPFSHIPTDCNTNDFYTGISSDHEPDFSYNSTNNGLNPTSRTRRSHSMIPTQEQQRIIRATTAIPSSSSSSSSSSLLLLRKEEEKSNMGSMGSTTGRSYK